ncbi:MAG: hypothetical protein ACRDKJ_13660 [Actinomycetota bacterium]
MRDRLLILLAGVAIGAAAALPLAARSESDARRQSVTVETQQAPAAPGDRHELMDEMMGPGASERMHDAMPADMRRMDGEMMAEMESMVGSDTGMMRDGPMDGTRGSGKPMMRAPSAGRGMMTP